jgi:hypothetical protein
VTVVAGFLQSTQVAQSGWSPELSGPFSATLPLAAGRFNGSAANGPTPISQGLIVHSSGMIAKIVLLTPDHFARLPASGRQGCYLPQHPFFFSMSQAVQLLFHPLAPGGFLLRM